MSAGSQPQPSDAIGSVSAFRSAAVVVAFATAIVVTTEFIMVGLLPATARHLEVSLAEAGRLVSWFALASAIGGPALTIAMGRVAPRWTLVIVMLVFAVGNVLTAVTRSYGGMALIRIVEGASLPVLVSVGSAATAQLAGQARAGRAVAIVYVGVVVGLVLAVPVAVMVAEASGWSTTFLALATLSLVAATLCGGLFPDTETSRLASAWRQISVLGQRALLAHLLLSAVLGAAMFAPYTYLAAFLAALFGLEGRSLAFALMWFGVAGLLGNWITGRVVDRGPTATTVVIASVLIGVMVTIPIAIEAPMLLLPLLTVWGASHAAAFLASQVRVMHVVPDAQALGAALNISAGNGGIAAGAAVGGWLVEHRGLYAIGSGGLILAVAALALALVLLRGSTSRHARAARSDPLVAL